MTQQDVKSLEGMGGKKEGWIKWKKSHYRQAALGVDSAITNATGRAAIWP